MAYSVRVRDFPGIPLAKHAPVHSVYSGAILVGIGFDQVLGADQDELLVVGAIIGNAPIGFACDAHDTKGPTEAKWPIAGGTMITDHELWLNAVGACRHIQGDTVAARPRVEVSFKGGAQALHSS